MKKIIFSLALLLTVSLFSYAQEVSVNDVTILTTAESISENNNADSGNYNVVMFFRKSDGSEAIIVDNVYFGVNQSATGCSVYYNVISGPHEGTFGSVSTGPDWRLGVVNEIVRLSGCTSVQIVRQ